MKRVRLRDERIKNFDARLRRLTAPPPPPPQVGVVWKQEQSKIGPARYVAFSGSVRLYSITFGMKAASDEKWKLYTHLPPTAKQRNLGHVSMASSASVPALKKKAEAHFKDWLQYACLEIPSAQKSKRSK